MKPSRLSVMIATGTMAVGALVGIAGARTASAALMIPTPLCIDSSTDGNVCLYNPGTAGLGDRAFWSAQQSPQIEWTYPNTSGAIGEIVSSSNTCLQLNNSDSNFVRYATCTGDNAELWNNIYNPVTGRTEFFSEWALYNGSEGYQCLSEDYNGGNRLVKADPCDPGGITNYWYQQFGTT
jgi:hypothetical protein